MGKFKLDFPLDLYFVWFLQSKNLKKTLMFTMLHKYQLHVINLKVIRKNV